MMRKKHVSNILEECLDQVISDQETLDGQTMIDGQERIDSILASYPEYENTLRPELEAAQWLYKQGRSVDMRPGYISTSRQRLVNQLKLEEPKPLMIKQPILAWNRSVTRLTLAVLFLVVAVFAYNGGSKTVGASLPGDRLYDLKLASENLQLSLISDTAAAATIRINLADKRAREAEHLLDFRRFEDAEVALDGYQRNISIAADLIRNLQDDPKIQVILMKKLAATLTIYNESFSTIADARSFPNHIVSVLNSTVAFNDDLSRSIVFWIEGYDDVILPILATVAPTATLTQPPTATTRPSMEQEEPTEPNETPEPGETPELPDPSNDSDDDDEELKPTKKPTKTPKDKDKDDDDIDKDKDKDKDDDKDKEEDKNK